MKTIKYVLFATIALFLLPVYASSLSAKSEVKTVEVATKVNINTAGVAQLSTLPGIGEKKARDIIQYREQNGQFKTLEQLQSVKGIGPKLLARIKHQAEL
ncbi:Late competence protein ComEA, DNA receptor [Pseudoalteromonas luteoviolacea B = ATCC 29581]|nr:Late competence protein ComEA, DNA receptor [Pseudoalteromonas luteoviolacea B = ATCC 29581]